MYSVADDGHRQGDISGVRVRGGGRVALLIFRI